MPSLSLSWNDLGQIWYKDVVVHQGDEGADDNDEDVFVDQGDEVDDDNDEDTRRSRNRMDMIIGHYLASADKYALRTNDSIIQRQQYYLSTNRIA